MIGLAGEDAPADLAVGGGEEDLRRLEMEPEVLLHCDGGFRHWSSYGVVVFSRGVQDDICHKVASCEGKTAAGISRDGYASITR